MTKRCRTCKKKRENQTGELNRQKEVRWPKDIKRVSVTAADLERNGRISEKTSQSDRLDVMSGPNGNRKPLKRRWKSRQVPTDQRKKSFRQISGDENEEKTCQQLQAPSLNCCHVVDVITSWYSVEGICTLFDSGYEWIPTSIWQFVSHLQGQNS